MKCPICQFSEITENSSNCPNCNSDLDLLNNIKLVSKKNKTNNLIFILIFSALIIFIFIAFFKLCKYQKNDNGDNNVIIEQLKLENAALIDSIIVINNQLKSDTIKITGNQNLNKNAETEEYIVQKNDNLWIIAQKIYGDGFKFIDIAKDNNLKKPYEILIGSKLIIKK